MSAVVFLLLALAIIVVGSVVVYFRQRTPSSLDAGIDSFRREMQALAVRQGNSNGAGNGNGVAGTHGNGRAGDAGTPGESASASASGTSASEASGPSGTSSRRKG